MHKIGIVFLLKTTVFLVNFSICSVYLSAHFPTGRPAPKFLLKKSLTDYIINVNLNGREVLLWLKCYT